MTTNGTNTCGPSLRLGRVLPSPNRAKMLAQLNPKKLTSPDLKPSKAFQVLRPVMLPPVPTREGGILQRRTAPSKRLTLLEIRRQELARRKVRGGSALASEAAVGQDTKRDYGRRLERFMVWCRTEGIEISFTNMDTLDEALTEYFDFAFLEERHDSDTGSKLVAAVQDAYPKLAKAHQRGLLPVSLRAMQGWTKLHPPGIGETLPGEGGSGICCELMRNRHDEMALMTALAMDTFLRPGVLAGLTCMDVIPGSKKIKAFSLASILLHPYSRGVPSKQGKFNLWVMLDHPESQWLTDLVLKQRQRRMAMLGSQAPLFSATLQQWRVHFLSAAESLGIEIRTLYCLRHAGASDSYLSGARNLTEIKKRGHWESDRSVKWYEQGAASRAMVNTWTFRLRSHLESCHYHLKAIMMRQLVAPAFTKAVAEKASARRYPVTTR